MARFGIGAGRKVSRSLRERKWQITSQTSPTPAAPFFENRWNAIGSGVGKTVRKDLAGIKRIRISKAIIDDQILCQKNDNTTWNRYSNEQIADFGAIDIVEDSVQDSYNEEYDRWNYAYFYFVVDESGAVWKIRENNPSDCQKIAEGFDSWEGTENQIYGFRTADGYSYDFETNTKEASALDADKTLWLTEQDTPYPDFK